MRTPRPAALVAALALALAPLAGGCITRQGTLQVAAATATDLDLRDIDLTRVPVRRDVVGRDTRVTSILFVPTFAAPRLDRAVEDALLAGAGDLMTRVRVRSIDAWFLIGISTIEVEGDVVDLSGKRELAP